MLFENRPPARLLKDLVKEYWIFEDLDHASSTQKIIPDGYSEIIIHYGDPYEINLRGSWESQSSFLFSSQISKYFHLRNTGISKMIGIKLHPTAFFELFHKEVSNYTDQVISLDHLTSVGELEKLKAAYSINDKVELAENWLLDHLKDISEQTKIRKCISMIFDSHGMIEIEEISQKINLSTRQVERLFKKVVGLTPKFYSRIIRFNYIFEVMKEQKDSWVKTALQSGYFDQSHFIKNFKEFTGEEPSAYGFDKANLANFFLKK
ncbi:DUF6597 domain-containing transcriptional factor [Ekhidna sp.]